MSERRSAYDDLFHVGPYGYQEHSYQEWFRQSKNFWRKRKMRDTPRRVSRKPGYLRNNILQYQKARLAYLRCFEFDF